MEETELEDVSCDTVLSKKQQPSRDGTKEGLKRFFPVEKITAPSTTSHVMKIAVPEVVAKCNADVPFTLRFGRNRHFKRMIETLSGRKIFPASAHEI